MSQAARSAAVASPPPARPRRHPINRDELSNLPTRKGKEGALQFFAEIGVNGITPTRIRTCTEDGSLRRFVLAGHPWYADVDLWDWLQSLAKGGRA